MSAHFGEEAHGPLLRLIGAPAGEVFVCRCGSITLRIQHLSLRLRPEAFRELTQLLARAQSRLDRIGTQADADAAREPIQAGRPLH